MYISTFVHFYIQCLFFNQNFQKIQIQLSPKLEKAEEIMKKIIEEGTDSSRRNDNKRK